MIWININKYTECVIVAYGFTEVQISTTTVFVLSIIFKHFIFHNITVLLMHYLWAWDLFQKSII